MTKRIIGALACATAVCGLLIQKSSAQGGIWTNGVPMLNARGFAASGVIGGKLYVVGGGELPFGFTTGSGEVYDPVAHTWSPIAPEPTSRAIATAGVINGKLYVAGGCIGSDCRIGLTNMLNVYDPVANSWTTKAPMPTARAYAASGVINNKLYVIGGSDFDYYSYTATMDVYDPVTNTWTSAAPMFVARQASFAGVVNGILYVYGGFTAPSFAPTTDVEAYDPVTNTWTTKPSMPTAWGYGGSGVINGVLYAVGGYSGTVSGVLINSVASFDTVTETWDTVAPLNLARYGLVAGVLNGTLYAAGGSSFSTLFANVEALVSDTTPPISTVTPLPPPNASGWNTSSVTMTIHAVDNTGGSGVRQIVSATTGAQNGSGSNFGDTRAITISAEGVSTFSFHAVDNAGNVEATQAVAIRIDKTPPQLANLPNLTVDATSIFGAVVTFAPAPSDAMSGVAMVTVTPLASGSTFPQGTTNETVTVTDFAGNTTSRFFNVTVNKALLSIGVSPSSAAITTGDGRSFQAAGYFSDGSIQSLPSSGGGGQNGGSVWNVNFGPGIGLDPATCGISTHGNYFGSEAIATDPSTGTIIPTVWTPTTPLVQVVGGQITPNQITFGVLCLTSSATGAFSGTWNGAAYVGAFSGAGQTAAVTMSRYTSGTGSSLPTVNWQSTSPLVATIDASGFATGSAIGQTTIVATMGGVSCVTTNTCGTLTVTGPIDTKPPVIDSYADVSIEATGAAGAIVTYGSPTAHDVVDGDSVAVCNPVAGSTFPLGTTAVNCSAVDQSGNIGHSTFNVTVRDTTPPALTLPANIITDATGPSGAVVTYAASASDVVSGSVATTCVLASGTMMPIGTGTITCSAMDGAGNIATGHFQVLVQAAAAQVANLAATVQGFNLVQGITNSLDAKLQNILNALSAAQNGNTSSVCGALGAFINQTTAQSGKQLTFDQANQLITAAIRIKAVVGCQ